MQQCATALSSPEARGAWEADVDVLVTDTAVDTPAVARRGWIGQTCSPSTTSRPQPAHLVLLVRLGGSLTLAQLAYYAMIPSSLLDLLW